MKSTKRRTAKELAKQRRLQKERSIKNKREQENLVYMIGSRILDMLLFLFKGIVALCLYIFTAGSRIVNILMMILFVFLVFFLFHSISNADMAGIVVAGIGMLSIGSIFFYVRKN